MHRTCHETLPLAHMCFVILSGAHIPRPESLRHNLSSSHVLRSDATHPRSIRIPVALPPSRGPKQPRPHHTWSLIHHPIPARTDIIYILIVTVPVITNITAILLNGFFFFFPFTRPHPPDPGPGIRVSLPVVETASTTAILLPVGPRHTV